jgi:hypothetical protein
MLCGSAAVAELAKDAATVQVFHSEPIALTGVTCFQLTAEMKNNARESQLPPGLHPTIPAALIVQAFDVGDSPWGPFRFLVLRVSCRSGVRARGFTRATLVSTATACEGLRGQLGYPATPGAIQLRHGYDGVSLAATDPGGGRILAVEAIDPEPMGPDDVQYTGTLNLAHTPKGLRLMQVEMDTDVRQVERLTARIDTFDGGAFGDSRLQPTRPIAASVVTMDAQIPPVRFVCKPDELAFTGTEPV